ncbi:MAG: leucine--tRNA ligase [Patescibacteria group bacterium]|nr:leucine--tRNA ligase [Patescibacteria group bacterium]
MNTTKYNHKLIESKWQKKWKKDKLYETGEDQKKPKYYILDMFPYPSGAGLHVGHPKGYIATDIFARMKMMQGYNVLHPIGWDAFGLPAENFALKNKIHPRASTDKNIATFKRQLARLGFSYDWEREINTTDPEFYKWTQWIFLQMFKKGLAYESHEPIIWCPSCKTGLAQEDLEGGKCERCGSDVERKPMRQWVLRITDYANRMLNDLDKLPDWESSIKDMQRNWIGKSEGAIVKFKIKNKKKELSSEASELSSKNDSFVTVFTTRPDTLFGATYFVMAPEHPTVKKITTQEQKADVEKYIKSVGNKSELERTELAKEKTGVFTGSYAINPVNGKEIPIWIADYVMMCYGTGAIMAVPAHDGRDWEFAKKYGLPIKPVVVPYFEASRDMKDKVREDMPTKKRNVVYALVKNSKTNKFLLLKCPEYKCSTYVVGGIDEGENIVDAGKREVLEETGYKNLKFIKEIGSEVHVYYYAMHKKENRYAVARCIYYELENEERDEISEEEKNKHEAVWVSEEDVDKDMIYENIIHFWKVFRKGEECFTGEGININSDFPDEVLSNTKTPGIGAFDGSEDCCPRREIQNCHHVNSITCNQNITKSLNGLKTSDAKEKMIEWLEERGLGKKAINYKLKDWVFSRQRYWGEPIPIIHCEKCGAVAVPEEDLPVKLPDVKHYEPSGAGESPLANIKEWVNTVCPKCGGHGKRETNTMPQWAGSSWYYLRYIDPKNNKVLVDKKKEKYWSPVDFYVGGAEHATRHLIYARFWHKFLFDIGAVNYEEPFKKLRHVGLIMAEDGRKMSKRWGNVINPDDIVEKYGADAMRVYEMFMGPFSQSCAWSTNGLIGAGKFLEKILALRLGIKNKELRIRDDLNRLLHKTVKKVGEDIEGFKLNTAVSAMMILVNALEKEKEISREAYEKLLLILSPFAPHIAEELWGELGNKESIFKQKWPEYDPKLIKDKKIQLVVQVNGKLRDTIEVGADISEEDAKNIVLESEKIKKWTKNEKIVKIIFVKGRLVNIVVK